MKQSAKDSLLKNQRSLHCDDPSSRPKHLRQITVYLSEMDALHLKKTGTAFKGKRATPNDVHRTFASVDTFSYIESQEKYVRFRFVLTSQHDL